MAQGASATASIKVLSQWKCSACGAENVREQTIIGYGRTNSHDEFLARKKAQEDLEQILNSLQSPDVSSRYDKVSFEGKCTHCGNCEPWGKTQSILFDILKVVLFLLSLVSAYFLVMGLAIMSVSTAQGMIYAIPALVVAACWFALYQCKAIRKNKLRNRICQLPKSSLPIIQPIQPQRPDIPGRTAYSTAKQNATDYTEDELKQLPTWKRVELMKQRENENKE